MLTQHKVCVIGTLPQNKNCGPPKKKRNKSKNILWCQCYYPHQGRDSVSSVCGIFLTIIVFDINLVGSFNFNLHIGNNLSFLCQFSYSATNPGQYWKFSQCTPVIWMSQCNSGSALQWHQGWTEFLELVSKFWKDSNAAIKLRRMEKGWHISNTRLIDDISICQNSIAKKQYKNGDLQPINVTLSKIRIFCHFHWIGRFSL